MRDILVTLLIVGLMPTCFRRPFVGLVVFSWLAYMRVQDLTWGFAKTVRWSYYIAMLMFAGWLVHSRGKFFVRELRTALMLLLLVLVGVGLALSRLPDERNWNRYLEFVKIIVIALFTTGVVTNKERLRVISWVVALSLGFYGIKCGIFGVMSLGRSQILQGPGGMLADNNDFSLAMAMAAPMLFQLGWTEPRKPIRRAFFFALPLTMLTVLMTRSRGGFLSLGAALCVLIWHSRNRLLGFTMVGLLGFAALLLGPAEYRERLLTIFEPKEEGSANARLRAWGVASEMALANPLFGVGFGQFRDNWLRYCDDPTPGELAMTDTIVAHNSYLQIWAECGTPAILLYLCLILLSFVSIRKVRREARRRYYTSWILNYATMFEASLAAFVVGSTFLNRAHFDLFYHWVALILVFHVVAREELENDRVHPVRQGERETIRAVERLGFGPRKLRSLFGRRLRPGTV